MSQAQRKRNDDHKIWMTRLPHAQYHNLEPFSKKKYFSMMKYRNFDFYNSRSLRCNEHKEKETMNTRFEWLDFLMLSITIWNRSLKENYFSMMKYRNFFYMSRWLRCHEHKEKETMNTRFEWLDFLRLSITIWNLSLKKKKTILVWWNIVIFFTSPGDCGVTSRKKKKRWTQDLNDYTSSCSVSQSWTFL